MRRVLSLLVLLTLPLVGGSVTRTVLFAPGDLVFSKVDGYDVIELRGSPARVRDGDDGPQGDGVRPRIRRHWGWVVAG